MITPADQVDSSTWGFGVFYEIKEDFTREEITIVSGAGVVKPLTVLGKITASGKYTPLNTAAVNGAEVAAGIMYSHVDATSADKAAVALINGPAIVRAGGLIFPVGISSGDKATALSELKDLSIKSATE